MDDLHSREDASSGKDYADAYGLGKTPKPKTQAEHNDLRLHGVDHTARPTWKLRETLEFYRDMLGLPLVHCISARGWGPKGHPDFLHFFFDSGLGSTIAFFYYLGTERPTKYDPELTHFYSATHTAWRVESEEELIAWKETLESRGVGVSPFTRHEVLESIYFVDPNGYPVEITRRLRDIIDFDADDAALTMQAAVEAEAAAKETGEDFDKIDTIWRKKAEILRPKFDAGEV